jgi:SH3-like domain-containing protein
MQALNQISSYKHLQTPDLAKVLILTLSLVFSCSTFALEFRSVAPAKAVLYDAPSKEASKLYILGGGYPVEIIVSLGDWTKVRDQLGALSWIESKLLNSKRTVLVTTKTDIKLTEDATSALVATVEKDVVLELVSPNIKNGWVKVKHRDGVIGFVQASSVWGLN